MPSPHEIAVSAPRTDCTEQTDSRSVSRRPRVWQTASAAALAVALSGCATALDDVSQTFDRVGSSIQSGLASIGPGSDQVELPPADLPTYRVGDTFIYSDGREERVVAVRGDAVEWTTGGGFRYTASRDFSKPRTSWKSDDVIGERGILSSGDGLWPLETGNWNRIRVRENLVYSDGRPPRDRVREWGCRVSGTQELQVKIGTFPVYEITCRRYGSKRAVTTRRWYYAPEIGHFVRYEVQNHRRGTTSTRDLVAVRPGSGGQADASQQQRERAVQMALETQGNGEAELWSNAQGVRGSIMPIRTFRHEDGRYCRSYVQVVERAGTVSSYPDLACRGPGGRWAAIDRSSGSS